MRITGNTIFITGGATGIGFALANAFVREGNEVIICGRRENKLEEAKSKLPTVHTIKCDLEISSERKILFETVTKKFKSLNVLINNAGIQKAYDFEHGTADLFDAENELTINLEAPIHLAALFTGHLKNIEESAIVNISSGLAFVPLAFMPVYCASKAAIHSFTISLRHQLRNTKVKVFEIIPPTVNTELDKGRRNANGMANIGISSEVVANESLIALQKNNFEVSIGMAKNLVIGSRDNPVKAFLNINGFN